ncbi:TetR/AcrR family transcriptional regulator [Natronolimnohabitans sp. A-GB9]|uniref:TetR/AcrR family transcriptional regulator n=1 Tax=Natronolimnohabitans sp. A-GB9 TaxID=3069757 RepID=UPI0027B6EA46|nr:TetR/AcrR family transcriptional regulator [Natronolimnohabitans sp. A-GB9]MDQ2049331.1 TetR/AcrR family transcriptional regulator [Natronolimnohabitans sp. A-GB9]
MKGFSDEERQRIRAELIDSGQALFTQYGLERTRIKDITAEVDIGTSTFYRFFDSKEDLYVEVLLRETDRLNAELEAKVETTDDPREQVRRTLHLIFEEVESNPIIHNLIIGGELRTLHKELSPAKCETLSYQFDDRVFSPAQEWTDLDSFRYDDEEVVNYIIRMLVFTSRAQNIVSHRDAMSYEEIRGEMIDVVVSGFFEE